jgi:hypothetical protein
VHLSLIVVACMTVRVLSADWVTCRDGLLHRKEAVAGNVGVKMVIYLLELSGSFWHGEKNTGS